MCPSGCGAGSGFGWATGCSSGSMGSRPMMEAGLSIARTFCTLGCWSSAGIACTICSDQSRSALLCALFCPIPAAPNSGS